MPDASTYFANDRPDLRAWMRQFRMPYVEVGCGEGRMLAKLKAEARVTGPSIGIELDAEAAAKASKVFDTVHVGDVMAHLDDFHGAGTVVYADILEHLVDPWTVLRQASARMQAGGIVYMSIPNIAFRDVSWPLFWRGHFDYADVGIMDRTHLRFFTRQGIRALVEQAGLGIVRIEGRMGPRSRMLNRWTRGRWDHLLSFQYLVEAEKRG